jgi:hypothetical protein
VAGKSPRDKCFADAVDAYNDAHPDDQLPVESQKPWVLDNGQWRPATVGERIWNWIKGGEPFRVPDFTITLDGKPIADDNKFEGDGFSSRKGRSGKTQLEDQNDMNSHQNPDKPEYQDLNLNPEKCKCDEDPQPEEVYDPALAPHQQGVPVIPGVVSPGLPGTAPGMAPGGLPEIPLFEPVPVFVPAI